MLYLLDANVLITAHNKYYPVDLVPQFWDWLLDNAKNGHVKIPVEIMTEIKVGFQDLLFDWVSKKENEQLLILNEEVDKKLIQKVISQGYADDLQDDELEQLGCDPFLIAYALAAKDRCVVTVEVSSPSKQRQNRRVPDVCQTFSVPCCDTFALCRALKFSTK